MSKQRDWSRDGADAIIDHLMPVLRAAAKTGDTNNVMRVYAVALGAWHGSLQADAGPEYGPHRSRKMEQDSPAVGAPVEPSVRPHARKMRQTSEDNYIGDGDYRMQREYGLTPNGNNIGGRWVLRGPDAEWIDCDQYRHDLLARHGFVTA